MKSGVLNGEGGFKKDFSIFKELKNSSGLACVNVSKMLMMDSKCELDAEKGGKLLSDRGSKTRYRQQGFVPTLICQLIN